MSRFVGDARDFRRPDEPRLLVIASDLLDELGVVECARAEQERAVKQWLMDHEPNQVLALSLRKQGFLAENMSNNVSNEPRRTDPDDGARTDDDTAADLHQHGRRRTTADGRRPTSSS